MRKIIALLVLLLSSASHADEAAQVPHYVVNASFDPAGQIAAEVTITLSKPLEEKAFLLSRRFPVQSVAMSPGVAMTVEPSGAPMPELDRYSFTFRKTATWPAKIRFRYEGPINTQHNSRNMPMRDEGFELFLDHMWFPVGADIQTHFTADATIEGLADDLVVVAQGNVTRTESGARIERDFPDVDLPLVAMRGLERAEAYGVEFYARDLSTRLSRFYVKHAEGAARYYENLFGPLPQPVRIVQVWRESPMGYARAGYTVVSEGERNAPDIAETSPAYHVAHEIAHAWWKQASPLTDDFWLVESTASYMALRYGETAFGREQAQKRIAELREASAQAGAVMGHGRPSRLQLYGKGPVLLVDLEQRIGRANMDRLMAAMSLERVHTTGKFLELLADIAGTDAAREFSIALHSELLPL